MDFNLPGRYTNSETLSDGASLKAAGIELTNVAGAMILGPGVGFLVGGSTFVNQTGARVGQSNEYAWYPSPIVQGSGGVDTVVNAGTILGQVALGGGNDLYIDRGGNVSGVGWGIYLEEGDDVLRLEGLAPTGYSILASGGDGFDTVVVAANSGDPGRSTSFIQFERLTLERDGNFVGYGGFDEVVLASSEQYASYNFINARNPVADLVVPTGQEVVLANSEFRSIIGGDGGQGIELKSAGQYSSSAAKVLGDVRLGAGSDGFEINAFNGGLMPTVGGVIDGGEGRDTFLVTAGSNTRIDLGFAKVSNFEDLQINAGSYSPAVTGASVTLSDLAGFQSLYLGAGVSLSILTSSLPGAMLRGGAGGSVTLGAGSSIGGYNVLPYDRPPSWPEETAADISRSVVFTNEGRIEGSVLFSTGVDQYDGRLGTVGGIVDGGAGDDTLLGGSDADHFVGAAGDDLLDGGAGADILQGGMGADRLIGGAGRDTFRDSAANLNGDTITDFSADDRLVISDASLNGFRYTLSGSTLNFGGQSVHLVGFAGTLVARAAAEGGVQLTVAPRPAPNDFNGDGQSDLLLVNGGTGAITVWHGQVGRGFAASTMAAPNALDSSWKVAGYGDFNGDGRDDVLWRHSSGTIGQWSGQTSQFTNNSGVAANPVDNSWSVAGVADYNGDGRDDILWRHSSGEIGQWLAQPNGSFANNGGAAANLVDPSWTVKASGDFNGDGRADILWQHSSGVYAEWLGSATGKLNNAGGVMTGATGSVVGSGDFNGDGRDDILMRDPITGGLTVWEAQANGQFTATTPGLQLADLDWKIVGIADYNGDGYEDLAWVHRSGAAAGWLGTGAGDFVNGGALPAVPPGWNVPSPDVWMF